MAIRKTTDRNKQNNNNPEQITELITNNNNAACNTTQIIATQTDHLRGVGILHYIDRTRADTLTHEQIDIIEKRELDPA